MKKLNLKFYGIILLFTSAFFPAQTQVTQTVTLMGSRFEITVAAQDSAVAKKNIDLAVNEISRIESLISEWQPDTEISELNRNAGIKPVKVSPEVLKLTQKAIQFSQQTDGAFDVSIAALDKIWRFDDSMLEMPSPEIIKNSVRNVGYKSIIVDTISSTIFLQRKNMKIGFGSIGKGYAADEARKVLEKKGVPGGIINASGDLTTWGSQANGSAWNIGIYNPFKEEISDILFLKRDAATTSGSYEKFVEFNGIRYSHIINPKTGMPSTGLTSVTVIGENATVANGLSTSAMVLGRKKAKKLMKRYPEYAFVIITDQGRILRSKNLKRFTVNKEF